jgi:hypothetical protein
MSERDVELFEALAGDRLAELGYDRVSSGISPAIHEVAESCSAWWRKMLERRAGKARRRVEASSQAASRGVTP